MTPEIHNINSQIDVVNNGEEISQIELQKMNDLFDNNPNAPQQIADQLNFSNIEKRKLEKENNLDKKRENFLLTIEDNIAKQTTIAQISYYKQFITLFENQIVNGTIGDPEGALLGHIPNLKSQLESRQQEINNILLEQKKQNTTEKELKQNTNKTVVNENILIGNNLNSENFRNKLNMLSEKDFSEFKNVLNALKNGEISVDQMDPLNTMTQIIKEMTNMDKTIVIAEFEKLISEKFPEKKADPELSGFKDILSGLLDNKLLLNQFVETIDRDLKGWSYSQLLEQAKDPKNLESADAKKSINTIFHMDENLFNQLIKEFNDPIKKVQIENIVKSYIKFNDKNINFDNTHIDIQKLKVGQHIENGKLTGGLEKNVFVLLDIENKPISRKEIDGTVKVLKYENKIKKENGEIISNMVDVIDEEGNTIPMNITPYFGNAIDGKPLSFKQSVNENQWLKDAMGIGPDNIKKLDPRIGEIMKNTIITPSGKRMSWGDAFSTFFNSPFFDQLKQAFYSLMATFGEESEQERYIIESNYVVAKNDVRQWGNFTYIDNQNKEQAISYISVLNKFEPGFDKNENINYKKLFTEASVMIQKSYIETCMSKGKEAGYNILKSNIPLIEANKVEKEKNSGAKEFISGSVIDELKINKDAKGKVEKKGEGDNQYLLIDGQVIPLIDGKGSLFIQGTDGAIFEKNIIIEKKDNKENITILDGEKLDMGLLETIKKEGTGLLVGLGDAKRVQLLKYYMLEQSSIDNKQNPINVLMKGVSQLGPDQKDKAEIAIVKFKKAFIGQIEKKQGTGKVSDNLAILDPLKNLKTELSSIVTANTSQQEKRNATITSRTQSWSS